jgi:hypothetical protein
VGNRFWIILALACVLVGAIIWGALYFNQGAHLNLTGTIIKVRAQPNGAGSTIVVADFRITNPSGIPFVVNAVSVSLDPSGGDYAPVESRILSKVDVDQVFQYLPLLRPKYNDVLTIRDKVQPGQTVDRMVAATFEMPLSVIESRKTLRIKIVEIDGAEAEITERK